MLEAALASSNASLNRKSLAASRHDRPEDSVTAALRLAVSQRTPSESSSIQREASRAALGALDDDSAGTIPFVATLPAPRLPKAPLLGARVVPDVSGLPIRKAVHALHLAGFRVTLSPGATGGTVPQAGTLAPAGSVVRLQNTP